MAVNCAVSPARTFAVDGVTVTVVEPELEDPGSDGDVGVVVVVFAIPPHAHATSAKRIGNICAACTPERFERFAERIVGTHLGWIYPCLHFRICARISATGQRDSRGPVSQTLRNQNENLVKSRPLRCDVYAFRQPRFHAASTRTPRTCVSCRGAARRAPACPGRNT